jgi:hypothetical protein
LQKCDGGNAPLLTKLPHSVRQFVFLQTSD